MTDRRFCEASTSRRLRTSTRPGCRRRRSFSMASRGAMLVLSALVAVACGCRSINKVRVAPGQAQELTPDEAQKARDEGLALYNQQPRALAPVANAARLLEQAARALPDNYDAQWQAAQALAFLAENETSAELRRQSARSGVVLARRARVLKPDGVEGLYWYALNVGLLADVDRTYGLDAVTEM